MKYGLPYQGSKNFIANKIVKLLPPAAHFYDLFAGGCAITHAVLLEGKYEDVFANDISDSVVLFKDVVEGNLDKYEPYRFRSREEFFAEKDANPFVRLVYSFGSCFRSYLYSKEKELLMKEIHEMLFAEDLDTRYKKLREIYALLFEWRGGAFSGGYNMPYPKNFGYNVYNRFKRISEIRIKDMSTLNISVGDYRAVEILPDSVIFCDIPYKNTFDYGVDFDYEAFYDWAEKQTELVIICEYWMPEDRFVCIAEIQKRCSLSGHNNSKRTIEKLFVPKHQYAAYREKMQGRNLFEEDDRIA